jgi:F0F1-type ATP synthase delta subunit
MSLLVKRKSENEFVAPVTVSKDFKVKVLAFNSPIYLEVGYDSKNKSLVYKDWNYSFSISVDGMLTIETFVYDERFNKFIENLLQSQEFTEKASEYLLKGKLRQLFETLRNFNDIDDSTKNVLETLLSNKDEVKDVDDIVKNEDIGESLHFDEQIRLKETLEELEQVNEQLDELHSQGFKVRSAVPVSEETKQEVIKAIMDYYGDKTMELGCYENGEPWIVNPMDGEQIALGLDDEIKAIVNKILHKK